MRRFSIFLGCLSVCVNLFSGEKTPPTTAPSVGPEAPPSSFVNSVLVTSGALSFATRDIIAPGPVPLHVTHNYNGDTPGYSWMTYSSFSSNFPLYINYKSDKEPIPLKNSGKAYLSVDEGNGSLTEYVGTFKKNCASCYINKELLKKGFTNMRGGALSARTSLKNNTYTLKQKGKHKYTCVGILSHGGERYFTSSSKDREWLNLNDELLPSGNKLHYAYSKHESKGRLIQEITAINSLNRHLGFLKFAFDKKSNEATITSSNGKKAKYTFFTHKSLGKEEKVNYIEKIESTDSPTVKFHYEKTTHDILEKMYRINRIEWPEGRFLEMKYDDEGRVVTQKAPCGPSGEVHKLFEFSYSNRIPSVKDVENPKFVTHVYDAYGRKTTYHSSSARRIEEIKKYGSNKNLYKAEYFDWGTEEHLHQGEKDTSKEGCLLQKTVVDGSEKALYSWKAKYDDDGNIIKETTYGNLSGKGDVYFKVSKTDSAESYHKYATYSQDKFHVKLTEKEDDGTLVEYSYKPNTDLCTGRFIYNGNTIRIREFFEYDDDGICIEKIVDDGTSHDKNDLTGVTNRKFARITPVRTNGDYGCGQPQELVDAYLDLNTHAELLMKRTTFTYDKAGRLLQQVVYDHANTYKYTVSFTYDEKGRMLSTTDAIGRTLLYAYDANGNKIREELKGAGSYTTFTYDLMNRLKTTSVHYDTGEVLTTENEYNLVGSLISKKDPFGNVTEYVYDDFNRCVQEIFPPVDGKRAVIKKSYDIFDKVISETDGNGNVTTYERTVRGDAYKITYPDGAQERFEYNLNGTIKNKWEKNGLRHEFSYDFLRRPVVENVYDTAGTLLHTLTNEYNSFHLIRTVDPMGYVTTYSYDFAGRKVEEKKEFEGKCSRSTYLYDTFGRLQTTRVWSSDTEYVATAVIYDNLDRVVVQEMLSSNNTLLSQEKVTYDIFGNKTIVETLHDDSSSFTKKALYNSKNLVVETVDEMGSHSHASYNFFYKNAQGQSVLEKTLRDPLGRESVTIHDVFRRPIKVLVKNGSTILSETRFSYDTIGNKIRQEDDVYVSGVKQKTYVVTWKYDACNRPIEIIEQPETIDAKITKQEYTVSGAVKTVYKPNGVVLNHSYDALNRLQELSSSDNSVHYVYAYDRNSNILGVDDKIHNFTLHNVYDAWNRLAQEDFLCTTVKYTYDGMGRVTNYIMPDALSVEYKYTNGHLTDAVRLDAKGSEIYRHTYSKINYCEEVVESILPIQAGKITTTWDAKGRAVDILAPGYHQSIPASGIDASGNVKEVFLTDTLGTYHNQYEYDELYQLSKETGVMNHSYSHDSIHNRIKKDNSPYTVDLLNRLQSTAETHYTHDRNGNTLSETTNGKTTRYTYDALGRLTNVETELQRVEYIYDYQNRRMSKKVFTPIPGGWKVATNEKYFYFKKKEIGSVDSENCIQEFRILGRGKGAEIGASCALELQGVIYVPIHDARGNIVELLSLTGEVLETIHYSAFGEFESSNDTGKSRSPWLFVSKRYDPETNLFYFGERYYSTSVGRFTTPDPLGFADGPNLYAYVHNSPLILLDLWGLATEVDKVPAELAAPSSQDQSPSSENSAKGEGSTAPAEQQYPHSFPKEGDEHQIGFLRIGNTRYLAFRGKIEKDKTVSGILEEYKDYKQPCLVFLEGPKGQIPGHKTLAFGNGFVTNLTGAIHHGIYLSNLSGGYNITCVFNNSTLSQNGVSHLCQNVKGISTEANDLLTAYIKTVLEKHPDATVLSTNHSQATAQAMNTAKSISFGQRGRVSFFSVAPIRYITEKGFANVQHIGSKRDLYVLAENLMLSLKSNEQKEAAASGTVDFLSPAPGAGPIDHDFESPTYERGIRDACEAFINERK